MMNLKHCIKFRPFSNLGALGYCTSTPEHNHDLNHKLGRAVRIHDYSKALEILNQMKSQEERVPIEPAQYGMVLKLYCEEEMLKDATTFLARTNVTDTVQAVANAILHAHCRLGDSQGAIRFFKKMKELHIAHDEQSYLEVIRMLARKQHDYSRCLEYLFRMKQEGLTPSLAIYTDVIYCLALKGKYKEAIDIFRDMHARKVPPETIVYNLILEVATLARNQPLIDELVAEMWDKNIHIQPFIFDPIRKLEDKNHRE